MFSSGNRLSDRNTDRIPSCVQVDFQSTPVNHPTIEMRTCCENSVDSDIRCAPADDDLPLDACAGAVQGSVQSSAIATEETPEPVNENPSYLPPNSSEINTNAKCDDNCCAPINPEYEQTNAESALNIDPTSCCPDGGKCNEECIKTMASIECQVSCEKDGKHGDDTCHNEVDAEDKTHPSACNPTGCRASDRTEGVEYDGQSASPGHEHEHDENGNHINEPCLAHLSSAFERYTSYLETARCICTSVLAQQLDGCCGKPAGDRRLQPHNTTLGSSSSISLTREAARRLRKRSSHLVQSVESTKLAGGKSCCAEDEIVQIPRALPRRRQIPERPDEDLDLEKAGSTEHVLFNVSGMTCTGCANNLERVLKAADGISNVHATFVTGTAEFDLDLAVTTVDDILVHVQNSTQFRCSRLSSDTQFITILLDPVAAKAFQTNLPYGVESFESVDKNKYRLNYDPCRTGARDILGFSGGSLGPPEDDDRGTEQQRMLFKMLVRAIASALFTIPVLILAWSNVSVDEETKLQISLVLATIVQSLAYPEYYKPALSTLFRHRVLEMDMLIVISITAAYCYSVVAAGLTFAGKDLEVEAFFETSTLLITLVMFSRLVAGYARKRAVDMVSLRSLQVQKAHLLLPSGETDIIDARLLQFGDSILIQPHSQVATDADVISGMSEVDESMLTGEIVPVLKREGDSVIAGTLNGSGILKTRVARLPGKNTITDIAELVDQAQASKPRIQELADKVAGYFIPVVTSIALIVTIIWLIISLKVRNQSTGRAIGNALSYGIAVLAVSCPCALGLAVPMVLVVAGGVAARGGVVVKSAEVLERAFKVSDVIFDKTGTLTLGDFEVVHEVVLSATLTRNDILTVIKQLVSDSQHPVSISVARHLQSVSSTEIRVDKISSIPGHGLEGSCGGESIRAGNPQWLHVEGQSDVLECLDQAMTILCVTLGSELIAVFGLKSTIRPEALSVVEELCRQGKTIHIVSGDDNKVVENVATTLGIPLNQTAARQLPAEKRDYLSLLMRDGNTTLFCGDGTNDAIAVAQASIGVQIGSSSDVTRATADVVLLSDLNGITYLLEISKAAYRRIIFNFVWAAVYNVFAILLTSGAFVKFRIQPAYVGLGEMVSIVPAILVGLTMLRKRR